VKAESNLLSEGEEPLCFSSMWEKPLGCRGVWGLCFKVSLADTLKEGEESQSVIFYEVIAGVFNLTFEATFIYTTAQKFGVT